MEKGWLDLRDRPSWERFHVAAIAVQQNRHNFDQTLQLAITHRDLAYLVFGTLLLPHLFPEFQAHGEDLLTRLMELTAAQDFLEEDDDV